MVGTGPWAVCGFGGRRMALLAELHSCGWGCVSVEILLYLAIVGL